MSASRSRSATSRAVLRFAASLLMLAKSVPGLFHGSGGGLALVGLMTVLGLLVLVGIATRYTAAAAALLMAVIYGLFHAPHGLSPIDNGGVPAILSAAIFLHLAIAGPGRWSLDGARARQSGETE